MQTPLISIHLPSILSLRPFPLIVANEESDKSSLAFEKKLIRNLMEAHELLGAYIEEGGIVDE